MHPCIPADWESYKIHYRYRDTFYHITVKRIDAKLERVFRVTMDDAVVYEADRDDTGQEQGIVPLRDDRREHNVEVVIGSAGQGQDDDIA